MAMSRFVVTYVELEELGGQLTLPLNSIGDCIQDDICHAFMHVQPLCTSTEVLLYTVCDGHLQQFKPLQSAPSNSEGVFLF